MSLHSYIISAEISKRDLPFSSYIMAAMRKADSFNSKKLMTVFPEIWDELNARYNAPGGVLPNEVFPPQEWRDAVIRETGIK